MSKLESYVDNIDLDTNQFGLDAALDAVGWLNSETGANFGTLARLKYTKAAGFTMDKTATWEFTENQKINCELNGLDDMQALKNPLLGDVRDILTDYQQNYVK